MHNIYKQEITIETYPYSCKHMTWNKELKQYILTKQALSDYGVDVSYDYKNDDEINLNMKRISCNLYDYILNESCKYNNFENEKRLMLEYRLAKDHAMRDNIKKALINITKFDIKTDGGTDANFFGLDNQYKDNIVTFLMSTRLINQSLLVYRYKIEDGDFDEKQSA